MSLTTPSQFLKSETRYEHEQTERAATMQRLVAVDISREEFAAIQSRFLGVFAPLEKSVCGHELWTSSGISEPQRTRALESDLESLGVVPASLPRARVAPVSGLGETLGRIYVLEGSRLGGAIIRKALSRHHWYKNDSYGRFFDGGEPDRWQHIKNLLDCSLTDDILLASAVRSAANSFSLIQQWMCNGQ